MVGGWGEGGVRKVEVRFRFVGFIQEFESIRKLLKDFFFLFKKRIKKISEGMFVQKQWKIQRYVCFIFIFFIQSVEGFFWEILGSGSEWLDLDVRKVFWRQVNKVVFVFS